MAGELTKYQYYGLVGQGIAQVGAGLSRYSSESSAGTIESMARNISAGGYDTQAEAMELQSQMELIVADAESAKRLEELNDTLAKNTVANIAMGRTGEGSAEAIRRSNVDVAERDVARIERGGKIRSQQAKISAVGAKKSASASRSSARQASIASKAASKSAMFGAIGSLATLGAQYGSLTPTKAK